MRPERNGFTPLEIKISNGRSKKFLTGFTVVELLTVLAIIAIMVGILVPTVSFVRNTAGEARQKTQLATIDMALMAFKGDNGDYPESDLDIGSGEGDYYCGAQKLAEALVGWDLLGFHPDSQFIATNHVDDDGVYDSDDNINLDERIGPYLEVGTANVFRLGELVDKPGLFSNTGDLAPDTFVLCDSFAAKKVAIIGASKTITVKAGTPILYYKADTSSKKMFGRPPESWRYKPTDNQVLLDLKRMIDDDIINGTAHPLGSSMNFYRAFSDYVMDPKIYETTGRRWPYRPDSYILISAGVDGLYGTNDDICNF